MTFAEQARANGSQAMIAGGGSDLLGMVKDRIVAPDVLIHLRAIKGLDQVTAANGAVNIGGLITLDALSHHPLILRDYAVLAEAAGSVATPQIRNAGTLAGNVCQRPWCWYFRNGFPCFKAGGNTCFSITGENQFHAIFGGGPSFIVHPSDTAPALVALDAKFRIVGPKGERTIPAADFFVLPKQNAARENALGDDEVLASIELPGSAPRHAQHISQGARPRSLDPRGCVARLSCWIDGAKTSAAPREWSWEAWLRFHGASPRPSVC